MFLSKHFGFAWHGMRSKYRDSEAATAGPPALGARDEGCCGSGSACNGRGCDGSERCVQRGARRSAQCARPGGAGARGQRRNSPGGRAVERRRRRRRAHLGWGAGQKRGRGRVGAVHDKGWGPGGGGRGRDAEPAAPLAQHSSNRTALAADWALLRAQARGATCFSATRPPTCRMSRSPTRSSTSTRAARSTTPSS